MDSKLELSYYTQAQRSFILPVESAPSGRSIKWKERSDVAYLAGYLGIACIFWRFSLVPLTWQIFRLFQHQPGMFDVSRKSEAIAAALFMFAIPLPGIPAPFAFWLGVKAWSDIRQNPHKSGTAQAVFAMLIGVVGTLILLSEITQVVYHLIYSARPF